MYLGLDVENPGPAQQANIDIHLHTPGGGTIGLINKSVNLPEGLQFSKPDFRSFTVPPLEPGTYRWDAVLTYQYGTVSDSAEWVFVSTGGTSKLSPGLEDILWLSTGPDDFLSSRSEAPE